MNCTSLHAAWLLAPLLAVVVTLSSRHRVNRPRLAVSCAALCLVVYVIHGCHSSAAAVTSEQPSTSQTQTSEDVAQLLLQVCLCFIIHRAEVLAAAPSSHPASPSSIGNAVKFTQYHALIA